MHDMYPGSDDGLERSGESKVNGIVYRGMHRVFGSGQPGVASSPNSVSGQDALGRLDELQARGVERARPAVLTNLAKIDSSRRAEAEELKSFNEMAELMEEAPGA